MNCRDRWEYPTCETFCCFDFRTRTRSFSRCSISRRAEGAQNWTIYSRNALLTRCFPHAGQTDRSDRSRSIADHVGPNLLLWDVGAGICRVQIQTKKCPRSCRLYGSHPTTWATYYCRSYIPGTADQGPIYPETCRSWRSESMICPRCACRLPLCANLERWKNDRTPCARNHSSFTAIPHEVSHTIFCL